MKSQLAIAGLFFAAFIANLTHWRFRKGEQLFYYPMKGSFLKLSFIWLGLVIVLDGAKLAGWTSPLLGYFVVSTGVIFWTIYSIWIRQTQRRQKA